jgi:hypothetical protein
MGSIISLPETRTAHAGSDDERVAREVREVIVITGASAGLGRSGCRCDARK